MEWLVEPFQFTFFRNAVIAAVLAGGVCALVGTHIVLRGMTFIGGALSHAVLPGVAIAHILGKSILIGGFIAGVVTSLGIGAVSRHQKLKEDTAIGILLAGAFALGVAIMSSIRSYSIDLTGFLFGDVLAVSTSDIRSMAIVALIVLAAVLLLHRQWTVQAFDHTYASAVGLPVGPLHYALMILLSLAIVTAMQTVGVLLILAMVVTPPATARLFSIRVTTMMWLSLFWGVFASLIGLFLSYYLDIASGAAIVLVSVLLFFLAFLFAPTQGIVTGRLRRTERRSPTTT